MSRIEKDLDLRSSLQLNFKILSVFGYWLPPNSNGIYKVLYVIYSILIVGLCFGIYTITEIVNLYFSINDLPKLADASFLFLTHMSQFFKLINFIVNYDKILNLFNSLNRDIFKPRSVEQRNLLKSAMFYSKGFYVTFIILCAACVTMWALFPVFDGIKEFPFNAWYPFDTDKSPIFELIYAYQVFAVLIDATTNISMDTTASGFMAQICGQFDVLNHALINLGKQAMSNIEGLQLANKKDVHNKLQDEMEKELIRCVVHHVNILELADDVGDLFSFMVLGQFSAGCIIICITLFEMTLVTVPSTQFMSLALYQACMLAELTFYCWYGNEIILKSSEVLHSAYFLDWTDCTTAFKRNMLMIMMRSYRPVKLYAGIILPLSLESLMAILRTSWSYFAVLNRVNSSE